MELWLQAVGNIFDNEEKYGFKWAVAAKEVDRNMLDTEVENETKKKVVKVSHGYTFNLDRKNNEAKRKMKVIKECFSKRRPWETICLNIYRKKPNAVVNYI